MIRTLFKTSLFLFCTVILWCKADNAMATCALTSATASVTITQDYNFKTNSNGSSVLGNGTANTFWSGQQDEQYSCPQSTKALYFCSTDDQMTGGGTSTVLGPGISGGAYAYDGGSWTTIEYSGCFGVSTSGIYNATGTLPGSLVKWKYAGVKLIITDSNQARNITVNNKLVGTIFLTTELLNKKTIGGSPLTRVYLTGTIHVPASCKLSSGSTIVLPDTYSGEYSKAGAGGKVGTGTSQTMSIACLGGSDSATIDLHVSTSKVSGDDIVTSNPDVGVRVLDGSGNTVSANNGKVSATLSDGAVNVPFSYVPVAITGKNPAPGDYSAIETISVTIP